MEIVGKFGGGVKRLLSELTVEPILIVHMTTAMLAFVAVQGMLLVKACRVDFAYGDTVCNALENRQAENFREEEQNVQELIGSVMMWRTIIENLFPILLVCLIGAWSDKYGRKYPMLVVLLSFVIQHISLVFCALDQTTVGSWSVGIISSLIVSLAGNNATFGMAIFSYVSDTTPKDKLTQKTAITGSCFFLGITIGLALAGLLSFLPFAAIFGVAAMLEAGAFFYLLFYIENFVRDEKSIKGAGAGRMLLDLFNTKHIADAVGSVFKKRGGNERKKLLLLLLSHCLILAPLFGEGAVNYLAFVYQFKWSATDISLFMTYKTIAGFVGNFVCMAVLTGRLGLSDPAVGVITCLSAFVANVMYAFGTTPEIMYLAPLVSIFSGCITAVARSIIFKIIPGHEIGKVNSLIGSLESLTPLVITPAYSLIYTTTFKQLSGAFYLLSAAFMLPPIAVYLWIINDNKTKKKD